MRGPSQHSNTPTLQHPGLAAVIVLCALACGAASAQVQEIFSRYVAIQAPKGEFAHELTKARPPAEKEEKAGKPWKDAASSDFTVRMMAPPDAAVDAAVKQTRVLSLVLEETADKPRPQLRVDVFPVAPGEPTEVDTDYVSDYAEAYPDQAFAGKFEVTEQGLVLLGKKKLPLAMIGGLYRAGDDPAFRIQLVHLSKERQVFLTFDCSEADRDRYLPILSKLLLTLELGAARKS